MKQLLLFAFLSIAFLGQGCAAPPAEIKQVSTPVPVVAPALITAPTPEQALPDPTPVFKQTCCKVCSKGKACGDSCISRSYTCHKAPGCACDG